MGPNWQPWDSRQGGDIRNPRPPFGGSRKKCNTWTVRLSRLGWLGCGSIGIEHQTRDPKTWGSNPVRSTNKICEFFRVKNIVLTRCRCAQQPWQRVGLGHCPATQPWSFDAPTWSLTQLKYNTHLQLLILVILQWDSWLRIKTNKSHWQNLTSEEFWLRCRLTKSRRWMACSNSPIRSLTFSTTLLSLSIIVLFRSLILHIATLGYMEAANGILIFGDGRIWNKTLP